MKSIYNYDPKNIDAKDKHYYDALEGGRLNDVIHLFLKETKNKFRAWYRLMNLLEYYKDEKEWLNQWLVHLNNNNNDENRSPFGFSIQLDEKDKRKIIKYYHQMKSFKEKREKIKEIIKSHQENTLNKLASFLKKENISLFQYHTYDFDFLIYALNVSASKELLHYILQEYSPNETFNYAIELECRQINYSYTGDYADDIKVFIYPSDYTTPLYTAIDKDHYEIAKILMKRGANLDFKPLEFIQRDLLPFFVTQSTFLNMKTLTFILSKGIIDPSYLLMNCICHKTNIHQKDFLTIILDYCVWTNEFILILLLNIKQGKTYSDEALNNLIHQEKWKYISPEVKAFANINHRRQQLYWLSQQYNPYHPNPDFKDNDDDTFSDIKYIKKNTYLFIKIINSFIILIFIYHSMDNNNNFRRCIYKLFFRFIFLS